MKFTIGDATDSALCVALHHEFLRCHDAYTDFYILGKILIEQGHDPWIAYRTYNAYARFIHHLYEFMVGALIRERQDTAVAKGDKVAIEVKRFISHHAQRILTNKREAIQNGTAPSWENDLSAYPEKIPPAFADDFRDSRNKVAGHVSPERASLNLSDFYSRYHLFLNMVYRDAFASWGVRGKEFPDLREVTDFTVLIKSKGVDEVPN